MSRRSGPVLDPGERPLRVGVALPTFRDDELALEVAGTAEQIGLDGVFVYDHLWPMGQPERPALAAFPVLGALAASTTRLALGTLVARVGLVPSAVLDGRFATLASLAPGRVIAGLGTGDRKSAAEHLAYGAPLWPPGVRRRALEALARRLADQGLSVWIGAGAPATQEIARRLGVPLNLWGAEPGEVARAASWSEVTWGGTLPRSPRSRRRQLAALQAAGASWVVASWPVDLEQLVQDVRRLGR